MNILFWNLKNNNIAHYIENCLLENNVDIAIFSEYKSCDLKSIEAKQNYHIIETMGGCDKIIMIVKNDIKVIIKQEHYRYVLYQVSINSLNYVIAGIHLQDRYNNDSEIRIEEIGRLINDIKNVENKCKCKNTIIIGDFNANPYDRELLQMNAFHSVFFKDVIKKSETRTVAKRSYRRFYNPILNFISEDSKNYGSFYHTTGSSTPIWHCLDQVLVGKQLVDNIVNLKYLKNICGKSLIANIAPNPNISDHLPLFVSIL